MKTVDHRHNFAIRSLARLAPAAMLAALAFVVPAKAETTDWAHNEGGRMRVVALPPATNGTVKGALQIEPNEGWITYWREPGDAGIPPQLIVSPDEGVELTRLAYPIPKRIDNGPLRDIGYDHPVTLPFELAVKDATKPLSIGVSAFVGLCRNICIPFQARFELNLASQGATPVQEAMVLASAEANLPEPPSDDFAVTQYTLSGNQMLQLKLRLPRGTAAAPEVIVTGPQGHTFFDSQNGQKEGDLYVLDIPIEKLPKDYEMRGKRWGILVIAGDRAMETSLAFN
ncbi:DsbC/DsbD-like thiol-disulfide interchange protein [Pseudorhizobium tarimense]|uniref:DsbC/DsbD-like thiol-disulfide interchange protein n=1 Tax=Pseudorhizobium tarimense TaxID=1079109 RepID=A0ABV2H0X8_9HYPH|nr:protein-disulfide reductase DsbD domain-containing protein [Pseudorhizobium tarimense]MCJ8517525.1 cytochrome C biogenesis protein [Pseudorhizobium tarimense]